MKSSILVVDDEIDFLESVRRGLLSSGFRNITLESDPVKASLLFDQEERFDIALIDIIMPGMSGVDLLDRIRNSSPDTECIMITGVSDAKTAVNCLKKGAYDYLVKPISRDDLVTALKRALERRRLIELLNLSKKRVIPELRNPDAFNSIITKSPNMHRILREAELHAASDMPILMTGESGTGKELLAKAIHLASPRVKFPFIPINMASVSGSLFDSEFFGHIRGAFTGAEKDHIGYLEHTNHGTLFLDEIGDLSPEFQGRLLRVLDDGEYIKLGTNMPQKVDIRFIAATNKDLDQMIARGIFRKDLYYRIRGAWLNLPPLREKMEDLPLLINKFIKEFSGDSQNPSVEKETMFLLMEYKYPGNVRELRSIIQSAVNLAQGGPILPAHLPGYLRTRKKILEKSDLQKENGSVKPLMEVEKSHILNAYHMTGKNKVKTAKLLGIGINTLRRKLRSY